MLELDSPRWYELSHAYGQANDIPSALEALKSLPESAGESEPWFGIWSALAHQGDVYDASYAAVPHVVAALQQDPVQAGFDFFQFPAWVEICRVRSGPPIPDDLTGPYFEALAKLPSLAALAANGPMTKDKLICCLAATAAAKNESGIAEVIMELTPEVAASFNEWLQEQ